MLDGRWTLDAATLNAGCWTLDDHAGGGGGSSSCWTPHAGSSTTRWMQHKPRQRQTRRSKQPPAADPWPARCHRHARLAGTARICPKSAQIQSRRYCCTVQSSLAISGVNSARSYRGASRVTPRTCAHVARVHGRARGAARRGGRGARHAVTRRPRAGALHTCARHMPLGARPPRTARGCVPRG